MNNLINITRRLTAAGWTLDRAIAFVTTLVPQVNPNTLKSAVIAADTPSKKAA